MNFIKNQNTRIITSFLIVFVVFFSSCERKKFISKVKHKTEEEYINESLKESQDLLKRIDEENKTKKEAENEESLRLSEQASNIEVLNINKMLIEKAMKFKKEGKYQQSLDILLGVLREESENVSILVNISELYAFLNNFNYAKEYAEKVLKIDDKNTFALTMIANFYAKNNQIEKAINAYLKLSKIKPNHILYHNIGVLYENENQLKKAFEYYNKAVRLNPTEQEYYALALISKKLNNKENTITFLEKASKKGDSDKIKRMLAKEYLLQKKYDNALYVYKQISTKSKSVDDFNDLASAYLLDKKYTDAEKTYKEALKISPNDQKILYNLTLCYYNMKDASKMQRAIRDYENSNAPITEVRKLKVYLSKISK
jgi:tetratricopeptide (TPR) repeat protein